MANAVSVVVLYNAGVPVALALLLPLLIGIAVGCDQRAIDCQM